MEVVYGMLCIVGVIATACICGILLKLTHVAIQKINKYFHAKEWCE